MRLSELAGIDSDSEVTGFAIDHRKVAKGSVFGAFKGAVFNGEEFIPQAIERGDLAAKERLIQSGRRHYSEMIAPESPPVSGRASVTCRK